MIQKATIVLLLTLSALVATSFSAPATEAPAGQASPPPETTPIPTSLTESTSSTPATDDSAKAINATTSIPVGSVHDHPLNASAFTCYGRPIGYYGDVEHQCKVYHFCLLGDYNGEVVYQRISYLCLNETIFDQQALDCVEPAKISAPCKDSPNHYENSNAVLRQAIVGNVNQDVESELNKTSTSTTTSTTAAPAVAAA